jgi:hypothetical protein
LFAEGSRGATVLLLLPPPLLLLLLLLLVLLLGVEVATGVVVAVVAVVVAVVKAVKAVEFELERLLKSPHASARLQQRSS